MTCSILYHCSDDVSETNTTQSNLCRDSNTEEDDDDEDRNTVERLVIPAIGPSKSYSTSHSVSVAESSIPSIPHSINPFLYTPHPDVPRTIQLLYVPDPTRSKCSIDDVSHHPAWVRRYLKKEKFMEIKHLVGFYKKSRTTPDEGDDSEGVPYLLTEWVSISGT